ncbi:MAG: hypothetical protein GY756_16905, partial [bacterium]|nr:hypothetical protein [bacterium]
LDSSNLSELSFTSDDKTVVFQVSVFSGDTFKSAEEMFYDLTKGFNTGTKGSSFLFNGNDAYIVDISFISIQNNMRGWFLFVNKEDRDYYLLAFASLDYYDEKLPFILSVLDSFRIDTDESKLLPGAISQFYYPYPGNEEDTAQIEVGGNLVVFQTDINEFDASQLVIEREAVLMEYYQRLGDKNLFSKAWKRYYRMIFRDNYSRFDNLSNALKKEDIGKTDKEKAIVLLDWLQNFEYSSSDTFSDLLAPISSVCYEKGDCDARGLSYSILLKHLNIESLLLVSWQYSHSLSAVNIAGDGARYTFDDNTYLIAETTDNVDIGLIPQSMSDSEKWIPVSFF